MASTIPLTSVLPSLVLVWPSNCARDLDADHRDQPLADVVAADALLEVLRQIVFVGVGVQGPGEGGPEPGQVRAALLGVDVVGERVHRVRVAIVPLQGDLRLDAVPVAPHVDRCGINGRLVLVEELDKRVDATLVLEATALSGPLVLERDRDAGIEEGQLAEAMGQRIETVVDGFEHLGVRTERDLGPTALRGPGVLELTGRLTPSVALAIYVAVPPDLQIEPLRQGVDH